MSEDLSPTGRPEDAPASNALTAGVISDADIARLTREERLELVRRLQRPTTPRMPLNRSLRTVRRVRLGIMTISATVLVPWIVWLGFTLPRTYQARHWTATWVGFDVGLVVMISLTVAFGLMKNQMLILTSFATGVLLICDAWFDIMTASPHDLPASIASAVFAELPIAAVLMLGSLRMLRVMAERMWLLEPGQHLWHLRFPAVSDLFDD